MKKNLSILIFAIATYWVLPVSAQRLSIGAENSAAAIDVKKIDLQITADKHEFKIDEKITVRLTLINNSNSPVYIYNYLAWGESASFSLWLWKDAKKGMPQTYVKDSITPPPQSSGEFTKLLPNYIYGLNIFTTLRDLGADKSGTYDLIAYYHSPISKGLGFGLPIIAREDGVISSNVVRLKLEMD